MKSDVQFRIEDVREAETAARAVLLCGPGRGGCSGGGSAQGGGGRTDPSRAGGEALAADLAGRKAIRIAEAIQIGDADPSPQRGFAGYGSVADAASRGRAWPDLLPRDPSRRRSRS